MLRSLMIVIDKCSEEAKVHLSRNRRLPEYQESDGEEFVLMLHRLNFKTVTDKSLVMMKKEVAKKGSRWARLAISTRMLDMQAGLVATSSHFNNLICMQPYKNYGSVHGIWGGVSDVKFNVNSTYLTVITVNGIYDETSIKRIEDFVNMSTIKYEERNIEGRSVVEGPQIDGRICRCI